MHSTLKLKVMKNKKLFMIAFCLLHLNTHAQTTNLIEGGKTLVELISVLKKNKTNSTANLNNKNIGIDSCATKQTADLCFKNSSAKDLAISLYKRTDAGYEAQPFTMKVITKKQECWYELHSGIYKYKIEIDTNGTKTLMSEGELRLQTCDNMQREITE
jgi:hypothetical protein